MFAFPSALPPAKRYTHFWARAFAVAFVVLWRWKVNEPLLVAASAVAGLALFGLR